MSQNLIIIGASGHGKVSVDIAKQMNKWDNIYFLDDNEQMDEIYGHKVIGSTKRVKDLNNDYDFFIAIGDNYIRQKIYMGLVKFGINITTLIHPNSIISESVVIDEGTIVMPGVVINADSNVGKCCVINTSSSIDHDNEIGDFVHVSPGANLGGNVSVGNMAWLGLGCKVINNTEITNDVIVGAGSVSIKNITEAGTYVGTPASKLK